MEPNSLTRWRKPGSALAEPNESEVVADTLPKKLKPREYKAFASAPSRQSMLLIKRGTRKQPETDLAFAYGYLTKVISGGYGFGFSLTFALPFPSGPAVVEIRGEGLTPLLEGILEGTVKSLEIFDPERHLETSKGDWDVEAHQWRGPCVIKHISVTEKHSPAENTTKY